MLIVDFFYLVSNKTNQAHYAPALVPSWASGIWSWWFGKDLNAFLTKSTDHSQALLSETVQCWGTAFIKTFWETTLCLYWWHIFLSSSKGNCLYEKWDWVIFSLVLIISWPKYCPEYVQTFPRLGLLSDKLFDLMSLLLPCGFKLNVQTASSISCSPLVAFPSSLHSASFLKPGKVWSEWMQQDSSHISRSLNSVTISNCLKLPFHFHSFYKYQLAMCASSDLCTLAMNHHLHVSAPK